MDNNVYKDIIVSSRIRLARNLKGYNFPHKLDGATADKIINMVFNSCDNIGDFNNYRIANLKNSVLQEYLHDHLISQKLIEQKDISAICVSSDNSVSIMINEEDVLRQQCMLPGLNLKKAFDILNDIDTELSSNLEFAYDENLGYITSCPTNLGTGIRVSVLLFLPALTLTKNIEQVINAVSKMGISVRGTFGEGSVASGYLFQVSNQNTLGKSEYELIQNVESTVIKLCELEEQARKELLRLNERQLKNDVLRAYGVLINSYYISSAESIELLSKVKMGMALGIITLQNPQVIDDLIRSVSAVKINKLSSKELSDEERDIYRADYIHRILKNERI